MTLPMLNRAQVQRFDQVAIKNYGIPEIVLMENAARGVVDTVQESVAYLQSLGHGQEAIKISVICGGGNNGGDGYAIARHLHISGFIVKVFALSDPKRLLGSAKFNRRITEEMKLACVDILMT